MPRVCIVTDSTAQFARAAFPGRERVFITPFALDREIQEGEVPQLDEPRLYLQHPTTQDYEYLFDKLSHEYDSILVMTLSADLYPLAPQAISAAARFENHLEIEVLDSRTTSIGLGWLVEQAARMVQTGLSYNNIIKQVREKISGIYFLFFIPSPEGLVNTRHITPSQAVVTRILDLLPIYTLEDGRLVPLEKASSPRAVMEYFAEFLDEFENPVRLALVRGSTQPASRLGQLRQHILATHPEAQFSEHTFPAELELLLGRESIGLAIMQKDNHENRTGI
jgi:DegV family protein with EDD domain